MQSLDAAIKAEDDAAREVVQAIEKATQSVARRARPLVCCDEERISRAEVLALKSCLKGAENVFEGKKRVDDRFQTLFHML